MYAGNIIVRTAVAGDVHHVDTIIEHINQAAANPESGICKRSATLLTNKIIAGDAVIAVTPDDRWAGFSYIAAWDEDRFVSSCALTVADEFRQSGLARSIKSAILELARTKYEHAVVFGLTTSLAVMKINAQLGYKPVTYSEITNNEAFWESCKTCQHYDILERKQRKNCLCTAMVFQSGFNT